MFLLFHFEITKIGPIKVSHLWKGLLLVFLAFNLFKKQRIHLFIFKPLIILAVLQLVNPEFFNNTFNAILLFGIILLLPILGMYVQQFRYDQIKDFLLFIASFFILSFVPYQLGWLESLSTGYYLSPFGGDEDIRGLVGPFQTEHSASTALAAAILPILYFWFTKSYNRLYLSILLILGFFFLIMTYVRTGMLMVVVGSGPMFYYFLKKSTLSRLRVLFMSIAFLFLISSLVLPNQILRNKLSGTRVNSSEFESLETIGSGRILLWSYTVEIFTEENIFEMVFGIGETEQKQRLERKTGLAIVPHNGFLLLLMNNGILGLILFILFIRNIIIQIYRLPNGAREFSLGVLLAYLIMTILQDYQLIYMFCILVLSVAFSYKERKEIVINKRMLLNERK